MNGTKDMANQIASLCVTSISFFFLLFIMTLPLFADETKPHRGEFPKCQTTCLAAHTKKMGKLMDTYGQGSDKITFQDGVDNALSEYKVCIVNCKDPMPVK